MGVWVGAVERCAVREPRMLAVGVNRGTVVGGSETEDASCG